MHLLLFGTGCDSCRELAATIDEAIRRCEYTVTFEKTSDLHRMLSYGIQSTPSVVLEGQVLSVGKKLSLEEVISALDTAARRASEALQDS